MGVHEVAYSDGQDIWGMPYMVTSVDNTQPLGTLDESVFESTSGTGYPNAVKFIDPILLTNPHEPPNYSPSERGHLTQGILADNPQPQISPNLSPCNIRQSAPIVASITRVPNGNNDASMNAYPSPSSLPSLDQLTSQPSSPLDIGQTCSDTLDGKMAINSVPTNFVCRACKKSFPYKLRYDEHVNRQRCEARFKCENCGQLFKHAKDRKRHLGSKNALPSCPNRRNSNPQAMGFACICSSREYRRKDILVRHLKTSKKGTHFCRNCAKSPCSCA
jgi:hypothetical protein